MSRPIRSNMFVYGQGLVRCSGQTAGAFRNIGKDRIANEILAAMKIAGYDVREVSPYVNRIKIMWEQMRAVVIKNFPVSPETVLNTEGYLKQIQDNYASDAYHSLSIEGYRVTKELIEKVAKGNWDPQKNKEDGKQKDTMAERGYFQAFQVVKDSIKSILEGKNSGEVVDDDHGSWYREFFAPAVDVGLAKASDLAGYRNGPVYIKGAMHIPPGHAAVRDTLPVLFDFLKKEPEVSVRVVLGHFIFVYIHPYFDGNGRMARFLMNALLASGNFPWTVIKLDKRKDYMAALEKASVENSVLGECPLNFFRSILYLAVVL